MPYVRSVRWAPSRRPVPVIHLVHKGIEALRGKMLLLLDIQGMCGPASADRVRQILMSTLGVLRVEIFADVGQAEVLLADETSQTADEIVFPLRREGTFPAPVWCLT